MIKKNFIMANRIAISILVVVIVVAFTSRLTLAGEQDKKGGVEKAKVNTQKLSQSINQTQLVPMHTSICRPGNDEKLWVGSTYQIQWCQSQLMSGSIKIYLLKNVNNTFVEIEEYIVSNNGIYKWKVPNVKDDKAEYKIKIDLAESGIFEIKGGYLDVETKKDKKK